MRWRTSCEGTVSPDNSNTWNPTEEPLRLTNRSPSLSVGILISVAWIAGSHAHAQTNVSSATAAIVKAVRHARGANVFNIHQREAAGHAEDHFRLVQISAGRDGAGAFRVRFELPGPGTTTNALLEVAFSSTNVLTQRLTQKEFRLSRADDGRFCDAVEAALKRHWRGLSYPPTEAAIGVSIMTMGGDEFMVMVQEIPAFPGGHTAYVFSRRGEFRRMIPGE